MIDFRNKAGLQFLNSSIFIQQENTLKNLELSFSSECDKACYYCYIKKYGDILYPSTPTDQILNNLKIFLNHCYEANYTFGKIDIFSGEFFALPYWEDVLQIILNSKFNNYNSVMIPTNFSFVDKGLTDKINSYIKAFGTKGKCLNLSCSIDSFEDSHTRPNVNGTKTNINNILEAIKTLNAGMHPMVSPKFLENYKENTDFWINAAIKLNRMPMFLEVRNDFWDNSSIELMQKFMEYLASEMIDKLFKDDMDLFAKTFFNHGYDYYRYDCFLLTFPRQTARMSCSFQQTIFVRMSDLALIPCHRMGYPQFVYGKFLKDKTGKLTYEATNLDFHILATKFNPTSSMPKCTECSIKSFCIKGCMGSQFEVNGDPFIPINSVCSLEKAKYATLHKIAKKYNLYEVYLSDPCIIPEEEAWIRYVVSTLNELEKEYEGGEINE